MPIGWRALRAIALKRDGYVCRCADASCDHSYAHAQSNLASDVDHIVPAHRGGTDALDNLQSLCRHCHNTKSGREGIAASRLNDRKRPREQHPGLLSAKRDAG